MLCKKVKCYRQADGIIVTVTDEHSDITYSVGGVITTDPPENFIDTERVDCPDPQTAELKKRWLKGEPICITRAGKKITVTPYELTDDGSAGNVVWRDRVMTVIAAPTADELEESCDGPCPCVDLFCSLDAAYLVENLGNNAPSFYVSTNPLSGVIMPAGLGANQVDYYDFSNCSDTIEISNLGNNITYQVKAV